MPIEQLHQDTLIGEAEFAKGVAKMTREEVLFGRAQDRLGVRDKFSLGDLSLVGLQEVMDVLVDPLGLYRQVINRHPLLTHEEEIELSKLIREARTQGKKDEAAEAKLIFSNLGLVFSVAAKFQNRGLEIQDLIQEGIFGLMYAVVEFDYRKDFKFSTYASWWIRQKINRVIYDQGRTIRLPAWQIERISKFNLVEERLWQELGRDPTREEMAEKAGARIKDVEEWMQIKNRPASLDQTLGDDGEMTLGDTIEDPDQDINKQVYSTSLKPSRRRAVRKAYKNLRPPEKRVINLNLGLDGSEPKSLAEIAREEKVTRGRIWAIKQEGFERFRRIFSP